MKNPINPEIMFKMKKMKKNLGSLDANVLEEVIDYVKELESAVIIASKFQKGKDDVKT